MSVAAGALLLSSCTKFLTVEPKSFMSPEVYFNNEAEMQDAVNGLYNAPQNALFSGLVAVNHSSWVMFEMLTGYHTRTYPTSLGQTIGMMLPLLDDNALVEYQWDNFYTAINNCNNVIQGIEGKADDPTVSTETKNKFLAEAYTLRAYYFFMLVQQFGPIPLPTTPTTDTNTIPLVPSEIADVYEQIEKDLTAAETLFGSTPVNPGDGHVGLGACKSILAKVYLTMAGYPLKDESCYKKAYDKALEVVKTNTYSLFDNWSDFQDYSKENQGEWIWAMQYEATYNGSGVHNMLLPYNPDDGSLVSKDGINGGAIVPTTQFIASYADGDKRALENGFFYSSYGGVEFSRPYIYKFFDKNALGDGKSGADFPIVRYADVLLVLAEAACKGGSSSDAAAIDAYYQVRSRAVPSEAKPASITFDMVYKERTWELCFEAQNWYDIIRTRKILNVAKKTVVDVIGFTPLEHDQAFTESDLLLPYPLAETRLNDNLKR